MSDWIAIILGKNPLVERVFYGHIKNGRHQAAVDLALVLGWKFTEGLRVAALIDILSRAGIDMAGIKRLPRQGSYAPGFRIGPFIGTQLPDLASCLFGLSDTTPIALMKVAAKLTESAMDAEKSMSARFLSEKRELRNSSRVSVIEHAIASTRAQGIANQVINVRGRRNRASATRAVR